MKLTDVSTAFPAKEFYLSGNICFTAHRRKTAVPVLNKMRCQQNMVGNFNKACRIPASWADNTTSRITCWNMYFIYRHLYFYHSSVAGEVHVTLTVNAEVSFTIEQQTPAHCL